MISNRYEQDLQDIREMMSRSTKFLSLSGLSGISAGFIALIAAYVAHKMLGGEMLLSLLEANKPNLGMNLLILAFGTVILAAISCLFFTLRKANKDQIELWNPQSRRVLINLLIPMITGGALCLIILSYGILELIAPVTLIFYGLGLINASHYTVGEIRSLGILEIILGLICAWYIGYGLLWWAIGFGVLHIIYGAVMYYKYES